MQKKKKIAMLSKIKILTLPSALKRNDKILMQLN